MYQFMINVWRRFSILWRLLVGFSAVIVLMAAGFVLAVQKLRAAEAALRSGAVQTAETGLAAQWISQAEWAYWSALATGMVFGCVLIVFLTLSIVLPMSKLKASAERMARGDLTDVYDVQFSDEVGKMAHALASICTQIADVVLEIQRGATNVAVAASELEQGSQDLSHRTEGSAARLQETASATEHINAMAGHAAEGAIHAATFSRTATNVAEEGGKAMSEVVSMLNEINRSIRKMGDFITVIEGIAFQTNILALNASVEAARAGAAGSGFSVVAAEVRSLSVRSTAAAKEVGVLIRHSFSITHEGSKLADRSANVMKEILSNVQSLATQVREIAGAAGDQRSSVGAVARSLGELDSAGQKNAVLVEAVAATATQLREQSHALSEAVKVFKLPCDHVTASEETRTDMAYRYRHDVLYALEAT